LRNAVCFKENQRGKNNGRLSWLEGEKKEGQTEGERGAKNTDPYQTNPEKGKRHIMTWGASCEGGEKRKKMGRGELKKEDSTQKKLGSLLNAFC